MVFALTEISALSWPRTLQAAAAIFSYYNGTSLAPNGRYLDENLEGDRNCTLACQNLTKVFGSADTFHNCLSYPTVYELLTSQGVSLIDEDLALSYGIRGKDVGASSNVVSNTAKCLAGYCNSSKTCSRFMANQASSIPLNSTTFPIVHHDFYDAFYSSDFGGTLGTILGICKTIQQTSTVNADISGIGVFFSKLDFCKWVG